MHKCFPLQYTTRDEASGRQDTRPKFQSLVHMSHSHGINNKQEECDYYSATPQLIFDAFVSKEEKEEGIVGYYGLPEAKQVA